MKVEMEGIAQATIGLCESFLDGEFDDIEFSSGLLTFAFTSVGVDEIEFKLIARFLKLLVEMKAIGAKKIFEAAGVDIDEMDESLDVDSISDVLKKL